MKVLFGFLLPLVLLCMALAAAAGYVMNIISLTRADFTTIDGLEVARICGVFVPFVGAVVGWM